MVVFGGNSGMVVFEGNSGMVVFGGNSGIVVFEGSGGSNCVASSNFFSLSKNFIDSSGFLISDDNLL